MKLKLKRGEFVLLNKVLLEIISNTKESYDKRFNYCVHRNLEYLESEMKAIQEAQKESPRASEFQQKVQAVGIEYADKDEHGQPKLTKVNGQDVFVTIEHQNDVNQKLQILNEEYKDVREEKEKGLAQFMELMEEVIEIEICKVSFNYFPEKYNIMNHKILKYIIKESDEEIEKML